MPKSKRSKVKAHHAKPYRKRHYSLLAVSFLASITIALVIISNILTNNQALQNAKDSASELLNLNRAQQSQLSLSSSYGFKFNYDPAYLSASALDDGSGRVYSSEDLATERPYSKVSLARDQEAGRQGLSSDSLEVSYYPQDKLGSSANLAKLEAQYVSSQNKSFTRQQSVDATLGAQAFLKSTWLSKISGTKGVDLQSQITSYTGIINGSPLIIVVHHNLQNPSQIDPQISGAIESMQFGSPSSAATIRPKIQPVSSLSDVQDNGPASQGLGLNLLDLLTFTNAASAASTNVPSASERVSLLYGPAVVKVYNVYCMDITLNSQPFIQGSCSGSTGSGFFVGGSGKVATNGHVVVNNPLDVAILYAFEKATKGDSSYLNALASAASLSDADLVSAKSQQERLKIIVDKLYAIPSSRLSATNKTENILVGLTPKQPDMQNLIDLTKSGKTYPQTNSIKQAKVIGYDYRAIDGAQVGGFKSSDVAILQLDGSNYPSTKLGNITSLSQGSELSILGYPGAAGSNQVVDATLAKATLTSGKVSAIKSATGSSSQLIETDATIGHGNSGGPAFNNSGEVVGVATYTIDGSGEGNGVFNYIRDIADLNKLASSSSIDLASSTQTQSNWQNAVEYFYAAKYSRALEQIESIKQLYPEHPTADQLASISRQKLAAGEEAKEIPAGLIALGVASFIFLITSAILIFRHRKKHQIYQSQQQSIAQSPSNITSSPPTATSGQVEPTAPTSPPVPTKTV